MSITNGYATLAEVKTIQGIGDTDDDVSLERAIEAASRAIDAFCLRRFYTATETRHFTPSSQHRVWITGMADLISVTTLKTDDDADGTFETTWAATDFRLWPYNAALDGRPYLAVVAAPQGNYLFPNVERGVEIAGSFGWPTVEPTAIKQACVLQAARFFKRTKEAPFGIAVVPMADGTGMRLLNKLDADVELLVKPYRKARPTAGIA